MRLLRTEMLVYKYTTLLEIYDVCVPGGSVRA